MSESKRHWVSWLQSQRSGPAKQREREAVKEQFLHLAPLRYWILFASILAFGWFLLNQGFPWQLLVLGVLSSLWIGRKVSQRRSSANEANNGSSDKSQKDQAAEASKAESRLAFLTTEELSHQLAAARERIKAAKEAEAAKKREAVNPQDSTGLLPKARIDHSADSMKSASQAQRITIVLVGLVIALFVVRQTTPHWVTLYPDGVIGPAHFTSRDACEVNLEAQKRLTRRIVETMKRSAELSLPPSLASDPQLRETQRKLAANAAKMENEADKTLSARCTKVYWGDAGYSSPQPATNSSSSPSFHQPRQMLH